MRDRDRGRETQVGEAGRGHRDSGAGAATGAGSAAGAEQGPESSARGRSGDPEAGTGDRQRAATALGRQPTAPQRHHRTPARRARSGRSGRRRRRRRKRWRRRRDLPLPPTPTPGEINYSQPSRSRLRAPHPGSGRRGRRSRSGQRSLLRARKGRGRPYLAPLLSSPRRSALPELPRARRGAAPAPSRPVPSVPPCVPSRPVASRPVPRGAERSGAARRPRRALDAPAAPAAAAWSGGGASPGAGPACWPRWEPCWRRDVRPPPEPASRPSSSSAPTTASWRGTASRARCSSPSTSPATPPPTCPARSTTVSGGRALKACEHPPGDTRGVRSSLRPPVCVAGGGSRRSEDGARPSPLREPGNASRWVARCRPRCPELAAPGGCGSRAHRWRRGGGGERVGRVTPRQPLSVGTPR